MKRILQTLAIAQIAIAVSVSAVFSQSMDNLAEVLFVKGWTDDQEEFSQSNLDPTKTYMLVFGQREGRGPINGKVPVKSGVFVVTNSQVKKMIYANDPIISEMSLIYEDSEIVDFKIDWTSGLDPSKDTGIISVKGNRSNLKVHITERHSSDAPTTVGDWEPREGFGLKVDRTPMNFNCSTSSPKIEELGYTQSDTLGCFWQENRSGNFCWVDASPKGMSFERCQRKDSCNDGGGGSGGGCYKYSHGHSAAGIAWK